MSGEDEDPKYAFTMADLVWPDSSVQLERYREVADRYPVDSKERENRDLKSISALWEVIRSQAKVLKELLEDVAELRDFIMSEEGLNIYVGTDADPEGNALIKSPGMKLTPDDTPPVKYSFVDQYFLNDPVPAGGITTSHIQEVYQDLELHKDLYYLDLRSIRDRLTAQLADEDTPDTVPVTKRLAQLFAGHRYGSRSVYLRSGESTSFQVSPWMSPGQEQINQITGLPELTYSLVELYSDPHDVLYQQMRAAYQRSIEHKRSIGTPSDSIDRGLAQTLALNNHLDDDPFSGVAVSASTPTIGTWTASGTGTWRPVPTTPSTRLSTAPGGSRISFDAKGMTETHYTVGTSFKLAISPLDVEDDGTPEFALWRSHYLDKVPLWARPGMGSNTFDRSQISDLKFEYDSGTGVGHIQFFQLGPGKFPLSTTATPHDYSTIDGLLTSTVIGGDPLTSYEFRFRQGGHALLDGMPGILRFRAGYVDTSKGATITVAGVTRPVAEEWQLEFESLSWGRDPLAYPGF